MPDIKTPVIYSDTELAGVAFQPTRAVQIAAALATGLAVA